MSDRAEFEVFAESIIPRLKRAFIATRGVDGAADAAGEAMAYAWEHWPRVRTMDNPAGYLYRVGQSRTKARRPLALPRPSVSRIPEVEPELIPALLRLSEQQRSAVWLVHACQWRHREVADALGISTSAVSTHVDRGMQKLRILLEADARA